MNKQYVSAVVFIVLLVPNIVTFLNYKLSISLFNSTLNILNVNTSGTHLSLGEWAVIYYASLMPVVTLIVFVGSKREFGLGTKGRWLVWLILALSSVLAWNSYVDGSVILNAFDLK